MLQEAPQERLQAVRSVHKSQRPSSAPPVDTDDVFYLDCHIDPDTKKEFVLWEDIIQAFEDALHVRYKARMVPFVKGDDLRPVEPRRIPAFPDIVLDVVVGGNLTTVSTLLTPPQDRPQEIPTPIAIEEVIQGITHRRNPVYGLEEEAMANYNHIDRPAAVPMSKTFQERPQETPTPFALGEDIQESPQNKFITLRRNPVYGLEEEAMANYNHIDRSDSAPSSKTPQERLRETPTPIVLGEEAQGTTPRRNPVYGHEEEAMANYNHIDRPTAPSSRGPQALVGDQEDNYEPTEVRPTSTNSRPRAPQDQAAAAAADNRASIIIKATLGDRDSQHTLGNMHRTGDGVDKDYQAAHHWYLKAAENGEPSAQSSLGDLYRLGHGAPIDHSKAVEWYLKAAEQGDATGQYHLGHMYDYGLGVSQDYRRAMDWYLKASDQGYLPAQSSIGDLYAGGQGASQDYPMALEWYHKAADQGLAEAQFLVGQMYENGFGVAKDEAIALEWYNKVAGQGDIDIWAQYAKGHMHEYGLGMPKDSSMAFEWFLKAASQDHASAIMMDKVGHLYFEGAGVSQDYSKAMEWLHKAAEQGLTSVQYDLGTIYYQGIGTTQDYSKAMHWFLKVANKRRASAQQQVGSMYYDGRGVPQDYSAAFEWLLKAALQGHADAQSGVGLMYSYGQGVVQDYSRARDWLFKAADQGQAEAQSELGALYHSGKGVVKDYHRARDWYLKAIANGHEESQTRLQEVQKDIEKLYQRETFK